MQNNFKILGYGEAPNTGIKKGIVESITESAESLEIAIELQELSGILVARWGLADLAEISNQPDEAMVQLSDIMTAFMEAGALVPELVRERISKLTAQQ